MIYWVQRVSLTCKIATALDKPLLSCIYNGHLAVIMWILKLIMNTWIYTWWHSKHSYICIISICICGDLVIVNSLACWCTSAFLPRKFLIFWCPFISSPKEVILLWFLCAVRVCHARTHSNKYVVASQITVALIFTLHRTYYLTIL